MWLFPLMISFALGGLQAFSSDDEEEAKAFLEVYNDELAFLSNRFVQADWNYQVNLSDYNANLSTAISLELSAFNAEAFKNASRFNSANFSSDTKRQLEKVGGKSLPDDEEEELSKLISNMGDVYGSSTVCVPECLTLEPGLANIMSSSHDYNLTEYIWKGWRNVVGRAIAPDYERYVELKNKKARLNGYSDYGDQWRSKYDMEDFEGLVMELYDEMAPLYTQLHCYVRRRLYEIYGSEIIDLEGKLPANILSDMWGRFWSGMYQDVVPYPDRPNLDVSEAMKEQNYTVRKMFETADDFYASMGLLRVPDTFWNLSMLEKPTDGREVICHATAWDFFDGKDFRIRMCTRDYSFEDLNTIHHEMGHTQYQQQYSHLPTVYRDGANDGFHEAIGEMMAMSSATPKHLNSIGLIDNSEFMETDNETDINFLMSQALITISTLPFHLVMDLWRWKIFRNEVPREQWNSLFWDLKGDFVGVAPPVDRTEDDLDPPTIFHVNQDFDMIRYFARTILQFQFAEKLCELSGNTGPFHRCDFSGSFEAGEALARMLQLGASAPWQDALESLTGTRQMSVKPILEFFEPLRQWLEKTNADNGDIPGWA